MLYFKISDLFKETEFEVNKDDSKEKHVLLVLPIEQAEFLNKNFDEIFRECNKEFPLDKIALGQTLGNYKALIKEAVYVFLVAVRKSKQTPLRKLQAWINKFSRKEPVKY